MNTDTQGHRDYGFAIGLLTGTCVGAGLMMWFAPRMASEVRQRMTDSTRRLGRRAAEQYEQVGARVGAAVDELARQGLTEDVAEVVAHGAREVKRYAAAVKGDRLHDAKKHSAADRLASRSPSL